MSCANASRPKPSCRPLWSGWGRMCCCGARARCCYGACGRRWLWKPLVEMASFCSCFNHRYGADVGRVRLQCKKNCYFMTAMEKPACLQLAYKSLIGLSIGDAFGETFFGDESEILQRLQTHRVLPGRWEFTDDTVMGIGVYKQLAKNGGIIQDELAAEFARNYQLDINRGYGGTAHYVLRTIASGASWLQVSQGVFDGMGSMGNGAAMRAGPVGAYFCEDVVAVINQARISAQVTHANEEGICGAIAVALTSCFAGLHQSNAAAADYFGFVIEHLPASDVKAKIAKAATISPTCDIRTATATLGNGLKLTAQDTVPFALWCAVHQRADFEAALWRAVNGLGDRDTICAIVGSIVSLSAPAETIPAHWLRQVEPVNEAIFF